MLSEKHDPEQHSRDFSRWSNTLRNANVGSNFRAL